MTLQSCWMSKSYRLIMCPKQSTARAVENVSFQLHEGELMGLVGESGCGKTTLMMALMRLLPAPGRSSAGKRISRARIYCNERNRDCRCTLERDFDHLPGCHERAQSRADSGDQIAEAIPKHSPPVQPNLLNGRVVELLELVGICQHKDHYPHQYSGGMRQRAMIAMALSCNPQVVIADEPTTTLDVMIQAQILELLDELRHKLGLAVIFVTHDLGVVAEMCDSVLVMYGGVTAEYASVDTIYNAPPPIHSGASQSLPDLSHPDKRLTSIPGYPPQLDALPPGCRFALAASRASALRKRTTCPSLPWERPLCQLSSRRGAIMIPEYFLEVYPPQETFPGW